MTKETARQRNFREMAEREKLEAAKALSFPNALLAQLARCSDPKYDFDIKVVQVSVDTFANLANLSINCWVLVIPSRLVTILPLLSTDQILF